MPIRPENRDRYPADWPAISRRIRFARALGQCECEGECGTGHKTRCAARHNGPHPITGSKVILTVAHLDHTPENSDDANLRAMCQRCHVSYDADEHAATAARTRAAETASWNTPLPSLEPAPAAPKNIAPTTTIDGLDLFTSDLLRVPHTSDEERQLAACYVASRARALGWTRTRHEETLLALFAPPQSKSDAERHGLAGTLTREQP